MGCVEDPASLGEGHSSITSRTADEVVRQEPTMAIKLFVTEALWCGMRHPLARTPCESLRGPLQGSGGGGGSGC